MELTAIQSQNLLKRFPSFELSYETISHKKVSQNYNITMAIPAGKKFFAWFTFYKNTDVCYICELNRDKKISRITKTNTIFQNSLSLGTIFYGTILENSDPEDKKRFFILEDVFYYKGIFITSFLFSEKLGYIYEIMKNQIVQRFASDNGVVFSLPVMWYNTQSADFECASTIPSHISSTIGYTVHHLQYRCLNIISPYLNVLMNRKINTNVPVTVAATPKTLADPMLFIRTIRPDFSKPQYRLRTVFHVTADIQFDIYHLFACGKNKSLVYFNVAYVPNYKSSIFMNGLFRNIRENRNLDYIEESDDEEDFENIAEDKYVNVNKSLLMECIFNYKFKKWVPVKVVHPGSMIVHISKLASLY